MYSIKIRKYLLILLALGWGITFVYFALRPRRLEPLLSRVNYQQLKPEIASNAGIKPIEQAFDLLRIRQDKDAIVIIDKILESEPHNLDALWGRAEVFRRARHFKLSELIIKEILDAKPNHAKALNSLALLKYREGNLGEALSLTSRVFIVTDNQEDNALAYVMLGLISETRPKKGIIDRFKYGMQTKNLFLNAVSFGPRMPETHLELGSFYLAASFIEGGNLNKAIKELSYAIKIAPEYADASARLAQVYRKKGDMGKFKLYLKRAMSLDPDNEIVKQISAINL